MAKSDKQKAQARVIKWKKQLMKGYQIAAHVNLSEAVISRVYSGNGDVAQESLDKILNAKEPSSVQR